MLMKGFIGCVGAGKEGHGSGTLDTLSLLTQ